METINQFVQYNGTNQGDGTTYALKPDAFYERMLLKMLRNTQFPYSKYAKEQMLQKNFGTKVNWRRFNRLDTLETQGLDFFHLQEGVTPDGQSISGSSREAVIAQYGGVMYFTDVIDMIQLDRVRQEYTVEISYQAKEVIDTIVKNILVNEGSVYYAGGVASADLVTAGASIDDFRKIALGMKKAYVGGARKAGGKYVALISPEVMFDLFDDQRMKDYMSYGQTNAPFSNGNVVDMLGLRFEEVLLPPTDDTYGLHDCIVIGEEAYAIVKLESAGVQIITKGLGSAGTEDALNQRQSIGWKINGFGAAVLNPLAVVNYWVVPGTEAITGTEQDQVQTTEFNAPTV